MRPSILQCSRYLLFIQLVTNVYPTIILGPGDTIRYSCDTPPSCAELDGVCTIVEHQNFIVRIRDRHVTLAGLWLDDTCTQVLERVYPATVQVIRRGQCASLVAAWQINLTAHI